MSNTIAATRRRLSALLPASASILLTLTLSVAVAAAGSRVNVGDYAFRRISREENADIQRFCENEEFADEKSATRIVHGDRAPPNKYPWATALVAQDGTVCGATIITPRHLLSARHCFETGKLPTESRDMRLMVGGVCHTADGTDDVVGKCARVDMREARIDFAAYSPQDWHPDADNALLEKETDIAIIQLRENLAFNLSKAAKDLGEGETQPACFPPLDDDFLPEVMHVYGWGMTENGETASHLMEVQMPLADVERDPVFRSGGAAGYFDRLCQSKRLFCMHSKDPRVERDGHVGDSGTGIIAKFRSQPLLYGATIAGHAESHINIGLRFSPLAYEICHYTGYCVKRAWAANPDARSRVAKMAVGMRAFFDQRLPENVIY